MSDHRLALQEMYRAHAPGLLAFLCARLGDRAWAEDLLHDLFVTCLKHDLCEVRAPRAYLFRMAHRLSLNALRGEARADRALHGLAERGAWEAVDGDLVVARELAEAMERLPRELREVLALRIYEDMTFQQIADILETPRTTVFMLYQHRIESMRHIVDGNLVDRREVRP